MINYYRLLGLPPDATTAEIERRCLELGGQVRPDIHSDDIQAQQRFEEIEKAFVTLTNPTSRLAYDQSIRSAIEATKLPDTKETNVMEPPSRLTWWLRMSFFAGGSSIAIWIMFGMRGPDIQFSMPKLFPEANIVAKCTTNGFGRVSCTFTNFGKAKGGKCIRIQLRKSSTEKSISSEAICSGLIEPSDVRDRTTDGQFFRIVPPYYSERESMQPHLFCSTGAFGESWIGDCTMTVIYLETD